MSAGQQQLDSLKGAGFTDSELSAYQADHTKSLLDAGFSQQEVSSYWGVKQFDDSGLKQHFKQGLGTVKGEEGKPLTFGDYLDAGWQMSVTGLIKRHKLPDTLAPEDAPMWGRIAQNVAQVAGDLPAMLGGAFLGREVGTVVGAAGGAVAGGPAGAATGAKVGGTLGTGYGAFAVPAAIRKALMDNYQKGSIKDASDFWSRASSTFIEANKQGIVGAATAGAGAIVGKLASPIISPIAKTAAQTAAEITTMVTAGKAMQGQLPNWQDFGDAAVLVGGLHLATGGAAGIAGQVNRLRGKLSENYVSTGIKPDEVVADAQTDPTIRQDIASDNVSIPKAYESAVDPAIKPPEPQPVKVPAGMRQQAMAIEGSVPNDVAIKPETVSGAATEAAAALPETPKADETAQDQVLSRIASSEPKSSVKPTLDKVYTALVDDLHPVKQLTRLLAGEKPLEVADDPYQLARLTRGSTGKADHFLEFSPFKFDTFENVGKPLTKILEPHREDLDGLRAYAVSKRALELEARGVKTGVPLEAAQTTVAQGRKYEKAFNDLKDYQTHTLEYLRDSGILGKDAFEAMKEANQDYVPFYRLMDEAEGISGAKSAGKGLSVRAPVKKIEGSTRQIVDPLESIIKNTYLYVQLAERNRALSTLADLADSAGERGAELMTRVESPAKKDSVAIGFAKENGADVPHETLSVFRPRAPGLRNDEIALYRDGARQVFQVSPEVATAVRALDQQSVSLAVKIMRAPASWMRAGTTLAPDFVARNFIRDQLTAFNLGEKGITPIVDAIRGLGSLFTKDEDYQAFLKSGGANAVMVAIDRHYIEQNIFKLEKDTGLASKAWNVIKSPLEVLRVASEIIENSTRLGEFKRQIQGEKGADTIMQGGMAAREVTLDFQRVGAQTRALNMIVAFWNAHVQGLDKTARAFIDRPAQTALKLAVSVTTPSVLLWFANKDDDWIDPQGKHHNRWDETPRWQKDLFWIILTKEHIYRIPKPAELGIIFGSLPERVLEAYKGTNPKAFSDLGSSLGQALTPSYIPSFMIPIVEQFANRSTFTGNPIVPHGMEGILPEYQYTDYTTESAKLLGKFATVMPGFKDSTLSSPAVIENYVRAWSGQLGQYALKLADQALIKSGAIPDPVKPASTLADIPVIKAFVIRYPSAGAQSIQDFYDSYDKTNTRINTIKYLAKSGDVQAAMDVMRAAQSENDLFRLQGIKEALATQTKYIRLVSKNPDIQPGEKRQLIDGVYYMMIQAAHQGNQIVDAMNTQLKQRGMSINMPPPTTLIPPTGTQSVTP